MPAITDLLPNSRLAAIKSHMKKPEVAQKINTAIADIKLFTKHPGVNQEIPPILWSSYGKDSMALWLLCEAAEIEYEPCFINNALELPQHYLVVDEFNQWLNIPGVTTFTTELKGINYLKLALDSTNKDRQEKQVKTKPPITFFDPQEAYQLFYDLVIGQFHWEKRTEPNILNMFSTRASEGMGRQWEFSKNGKIFQPSFAKDKDQVSCWRSLPIGAWQDLDVWAWLMHCEAPVSPVYGMNALPQRGAGRNYWPRTLWFCDSHVFNPTFAKWLKYYAPECLSEIIQLFPEVKAKLTNTGNTKS